MKFNCWILLLTTTSCVSTYDDLSSNKVATQSPIIPGNNGNYKADNAVDRNITTCTRTKVIGPTSPDKTAWWKVDLGGVYNIYSVNIFFKNYDEYEIRQQGRFAGFSLYVSNSNGNGETKYLCYKDGPQLPPLNFTKVCATSGRYIEFTNSRYDESYPTGYKVSNVITELCEVIVYGCYRDGVYGHGCQTPCPDNCKTNTCHIQTGTCFECKPGWIESTCNKRCVYGWYGVDCKQPCPGHCRDNVTCNHVTGLCDGGCAAGWNGSICNEPCAECTDDTLQQSSSTDTTNPSTGNVLPTMGSSEDTSSGTVVGGVVGAVVIISGIIVFLVIWFKRRAAGKPKNDSRLISQIEMDTAFDRQVKGSERMNIDKKSRQHSKDNLQSPTKTAHLINKTISVNNIRAHIAAMSAEDTVAFKDEYKSIPRGELHPCSVARKAVNSAKNRYTDMYPYDHSRVSLKNTQDGNDYINASYIENTNGKRCYIATQGPKSKTVTDFWTMVWQKEVSSIVCLTNLKEGNKNKCTQYWPNVNDKLQAGDVTINHVEERMYAEHTVRQFKICHSTIRGDRLVTMYHYTAWADHGVADPLSLVVFHRQVMKASAKSTGKYTLVHCSAGMGRTGTYIALDVLYREGERTGEINVPLYVKTMRKDRINMVQQEDQYILLYLALAEAFSGQPRTMKKEMFTKKYGVHNNDANMGDMTLSAEFEELLSLRKAYSQDDYASGRTNIKANYTQSVLPVENYLCSLSNVEGYSTYYNAVYLQSFLEKDALISAQYPLPKHTEEFLRLVVDYRACIVVFLCPIKDLKSTTNWFPTKNQSKSVGNFTVTQTTSSHTPNITKNKLRLHTKGLDNMATMDITVMECPTWRDGQLTENTRIVLDVIKEIKTEKDNQDGPILVLTSDGATSCGALCVVYNAIEQIAVDGEVDIFTIARQLQVRRPEFLSTWAEYLLCHAAVAEYLSNECKYRIS